MKDQFSFIFAKKIMARIDVIQPEDATGELKEIYDDLIQSRGKLAEVHKIQSLNPKSIVNHMDLYMTIMFGKSPLKRSYREMMAVVVSMRNGCSYCQQHHREAVLHYWKDQEKVDLLCRDYSRLDLTEQEMILCIYADKLTSDPAGAGQEDYTRPLKNAGWDDRAVLDATLVVSYFNFVNRIVMGLDVQPEENVGGYKY